MNEQLAAIKARRAAITPGVWSASWAWGKSGGVYNAWAEAPFTSGTCLEDVAPQAEADAVFIAAAPGDVDTLLAMVDALTGERAHLYEAGKDMQEQRDGWREEAEKARAERDALAAQLAQAQRELAAVPVDAMRLLLWGDATQPGYANAVGAVGDWLIQE